jgi:hypothetical protein
MAISDSDYKLLWGRAAGICSNPECREDLTVILEKGKSYNVGEMAHMIAKSADGPRGSGSKEDNSYDNLILLCPTCHTRIDKAPDEYPVGMLREWKAAHEKEIRSRGGEAKFESLNDLKIAVRKLLAENKALWSALGPKSQTALSNPDSNLHSVWTLRKLDTIIPNNHRIINLINGNTDLLSVSQSQAFSKFKIHAGAFERHQFERLDQYPTFPEEFEREFSHDERKQ